MHHTGEYIKITIEAPNSTILENEQLKYINLYFSIENHVMTKFTNKSIFYRLQGKLWSSRNLAMHINYATTINKQQSNAINPYRIIFNLLKKIDYPLKQEYIPNSQHKIYYITDQNCTVKDAINYCLYYGCSKNEPPTYLYHHIIDNQPVLINQKNLFKIDNYQINKGLVLLSQQGSTTTNVKWLAISQPELFSPNKSLLHYQQKALDIKWHYDHLKRQWTQEIVTPQKIDKLLTITDQEIKNIKSSFYAENYTQSNIRHYKYNWETNIYQKLKDLDLATNNIRFKVTGNILRDVGQIININVKNKNYINLFGGLWQTYSVMHIFDENNYINDIIGYRTFNLNNKENQQTKA